MIAPRSYMRSQSIPPTVLASILALIHFSVLLPLIGFAPIGGSSEAREAHIARIILDSGEWVLPMRHGLLPSKPPLFHWITAGIGSIAGDVTPFVARLTTLFFSTGMVFLTALIVMRIAGAGSSETKARSGILGTFAALVLISTYGFQNIAADARVDVTYCFFVLLAMYPILVALGTEESSERVRIQLSQSGVWHVFFFACGAGVLAKGPLAVVIPVLAAGSMLWAGIGFVNALKLALTPRWSWLLFLCLALPWYLAAWQQGGEGFIQRQLFFENLQRFSGGQDVNSEAPWYYIPSFLRTAFPWSLIVFAALPSLLRYLKSGRQQRAGAFPSLYRAEHLSALWFWAGFLFLSLASGKRHSYLLPLYPAAAVFVALRCERFYRDAGDETRAKILAFLRKVPLALGPALLIAAAAFDLLRYPILELPPLIEEVRQYLSRLSLRAEVIFVLAAAAVFLPIGVRRVPATARWAAAYGALVALCSVFVFTGLSVKYFMKGFDRAAFTIRSSLPPDAPLFVVREPREEFFDPLLYYLRRDAILVRKGEVLEHCRGYVIIRSSDLQGLRAQHGEIILRELRSFMSLDRLYRGKGDSEFFLTRCDRAEG